MSIKLKIPSMILIVMVINIVILLLFFQFYSMPYLENAINSYQQEAETMMEDLSTLLNGDSLEQGFANLAALSDGDPELSFVLQDVVTKEQIYIPDKHPENNLGFSAVAPVTMSGTTYVLLLRRDLGIAHSIDGTLFRLTSLALFTFTVSLIICGAIMQYRYVMPLARLKDEMENFRIRGIRLKPSGRGDELGELENGYFSMAEDLVEEKEKQNRIIASISHDIKTPLTSVMGFSERLIKKELDPEKQRSYLKTIYTQAQSIEAIVDDFDEYLSFSLDNQLSLQDIKVSYVCEILEEEYREITEEKGIAYIVDNRCRPDALLSIDLAKIRRVFANLIGNAIRHNQPNGLCITVAVSENDGASFVVTDNGKGVTPEDLEHIFEPFFTSDKSRKVSGLGLSICEQIVKVHKGSIQAENLDQGFKAVVLLPLI